MGKLLRKHVHEALRPFRTTAGVAQVGASDSNLASLWVPWCASSGVQGCQVAMLCQRLPLEQTS